MNKLILKWIIYFIPALLVELVCYILNPVVAIFTTREDRLDRVKRPPYNNAVVTIPHDYLIKPLRWFQSHDNAVDEWWYGYYNIDDWWEKARNWTQEDYDNSWWIRYYCRVKWLYRNNAYGFLYHIFGLPKEVGAYTKEYGVEDSGKFWYFLQVFPSSWKLEAQIPYPFTKRYTSVNIGWKAHKGFDKVMYANRVFNLRKYKD